jgi:multiple sugar transport system substrate-binding protein
MRVRTILLAAALMLAPLAARAADLVVWWEDGFNPEEDAAIREIIAAFEQKTGKRVVLTFHPIDGLPSRISAAVTAGNPPDFVFSQVVSTTYSNRWAYEARLVDLADALGPLAAQFDQDALDRVTRLDATTGKQALYGLPMGYDTNNVHVWKSLLEQAGFTLADIPQEWEAFWSFWCDQVQPTVRRVLGRDDVWGVGLVMSANTIDTQAGFFQFVAAYDADYVTRDGRLVIDEPLVRDRLAKALAAYTAIWRKGCTPPDAAGWDSYGNNKAFLDQRVVLVVNASLSIPNALKATRPEDYTKNTVTLEWPDGAYGQPLAIWTGFDEAVVFKAGGHTALAEEFGRFLVADGWMAHWLNFAGDRFFPPMPALLEAPFWSDPGNRHRMVSTMQFLNRPRSYNYTAASGEWRHQLVDVEGIWPKAIHRVVTDGLSPEQATDEAIARIKQLLSE